MHRRLRERAWTSALTAVISIGGLCVASSAGAISPGESDPRKIAQAVKDVKAGDKMVARLTMTLEDASGRKRVRTVQTKSMEVPEGRKTIMFFESPGDVRNTALLSIDYDDGDKDDDQWLYLPSLHKSTRISSSDKSGSFMGTDITYADMTTADPKNYDYKLVEQSVTIDGDDCWVIESTPRSEKERKETGYLKTQSWISKSKLLPLQAKMWVTEGKKLKYMKFSDVRNVDGTWIAHTMAVRVTRNKKVESTTTMQYLSVQFNQASVGEAEFTERRLEQGL